MNDNVINDFRITWRYCTFVNDVDYIIKQVPIMLGNKICSFAFDSNMTFYKIDDKKLIVKTCNLECNHRDTSGHITIKDEDYNFNTQEEHYLIEIAGMLINHNLMFDDLDDAFIMYLIMEPIYITFNDIASLRLYPLIKIFDRMVMIEYRVFPPDEPTNSTDFVNIFSNIQGKRIDSVDMDIYLYQALFDDEIISENIYEMEHDDYKHLIYEVPENKFSYLKDITLELFSRLSDSVGMWAGRTTYSIDGKLDENQLIYPLLLSVPSVNNFRENLSPAIDFREFDDYKHYVTAGSTLTIGDIESTYLFADTIDEEILFTLTNIYRFKEGIGLYKNDEATLIKIYREVIDFKLEFLDKYNHLLSVRKIMNYIWEELKIQDFIEQLKELIDVNLKASETQKNEQFNKVQMYFTVLAILLSSTPLYEYISIPIIEVYFNISFNHINKYVQVVIFLGTVGVSFILFWILRCIIIKISQKKKV